VQVVRELLWNDVAGIGFADVRCAIDERFALGYVEVCSRSMRRPPGSHPGQQRLSRKTGLIGESEAIREVLVKVEQIAPIRKSSREAGPEGADRARHQLSPRRNKPFMP
jgi:DNA-binding NtrC family response regulator